jgi:hypothetical protein
VISLVDPAELEHVLRPTVYRPSAGRRVSEDGRRLSDETLSRAVERDDAPDAAARVVR